MRYWVTMSLLAMLVVGLVGCRPSAKTVQDPRPGRASTGGTTVAIVYHDDYTVRLGGLEKLHPHPQHYETLYRQLIASGYLQPADVHVPTPATQQQLLLVHTPAYLKRLHTDATFATGVLECPQLAFLGAETINKKVLGAFRTNVGGTILAARLAMSCGVAISLGGGYHHASAGLGEGFNPYNDIAIAIRAIQKSGLAKRVLIIDLDAHQGNGSANIFRGDNDVYTFSMHERGIYPHPKAKSDWDIHLPRDELSDGPYLKHLQKALPTLFKLARPDLVIFQGGVDVLAGDPLTNFRLTQAAVLKRDAMVLKAATDRGVPLAWVLGGGYGQNAWQTQLKSIQAAMKKFGKGQRYETQKKVK